MEDRRRRIYIPQDRLLVTYCPYLPIVPNCFALAVYSVRYSRNQLQTKTTQEIRRTSARSDFCNRDFREVSISPLSPLPPLRAHFPPRSYPLSPLLRCCRPGQFQLFSLGCVIAQMRENATSFVFVSSAQQTACLG